MKGCFFDILNEFKEGKNKKEDMVLFGMTRIPVIVLDVCTDAAKIKIEDSIASELGMTDDTFTVPFSQLIIGHNHDLDGMLSEIG